jgi:hypothetical protein
MMMRRPEFLMMRCASSAPKIQIDRPPPHSSSLHHTPPSDSSSLLLLTPPPLLCPKNPALLRPPPPQKRGSNGPYITNNKCILISTWQFPSTITNQIFHYKTTSQHYLKHGNVSILIAMPNRSSKTNVLFYNISKSFPRKTTYILSYI